MSTNSVSAKNIKREKQTIDASGRVLGRLATEIAAILMGKKKAVFVPYLDQGDMVVVTNADKVKVTGKKAKQKLYVRHSGYPGGLRTEKFEDMIVRKPEYVIEHAVRGMLPHNKLGRDMIKKLKVFAGSADTMSKEVK